MGLFVFLLSSYIDSLYFLDIKPSHDFLLFIKRKIKKKKTQGRNVLVITIMKNIAYFSQCAFSFHSETIIGRQILLSSSSCN